MDEGLLTSLFDPVNQVSVGEILLENDMIMQQAAATAMGYLYALFERNALDDHPALIKMVKDHRAAFDENKLLYFGPNYFDPEGNY